LLAEVAFKVGRLELVTRERDAPAKEQLEVFQTLAARRLRGEPIDRILGHRDFFGLTFELNAGTLVPRPETELLVEKALQIIEGRGKRRILDLGTGTGCIAIAILANNPQATAVAIDANAEAVAMAKQNAETHGVGRRIEVREGSWYGPLDPGETFDVIVSNPPYIASSVIETLRPEVKDHDPRLALDGGEDGLGAYRAILVEARKRLKRDGVLILEIGHDQLSQVKQLMVQARLADISFEKDLADLDRMLVGYHS
jgi:release factor glutamine methyltransferase